MIKWLQTWWQVKKMARAIWRQVKIEQQRDSKYAEHTTERVNAWLEHNEFGLTREQLETHCVSRVEKNHARNINREIKCQ